MSDRAAPARRADGEPTRILCVFAHPDDEAFGPSAALAKEARRGARIFGLFFTHGQQGQPVPELTVTPEELGRLREQDLREVCNAIGFAEIQILDYMDGTLDRVPQSELETHVAAAIRAHRPQVVVTFGPGGITRHPDHVAVSRATAAVFHQARAEGLGVRELYFDAIPPERARDMGIADEPDGNPNALIDVADTAELKVAVLKMHGRHVLDARERAEQLEKTPPTVGIFHRAWPPVPPGVAVHAFLEDGR